MNAERHPKVQARIDRQVRAFEDWLAKKDLGPLEDVRAYVELSAIQNACDVPPNKIFNVASLTVLDWLDDEKAAEETFRGYRR